MMRKINISLLLCVACITAYSQARVILNNDPFVVIDNSSFLVLDNANTNAITLQGTGGNIVSEGENNAIRWNLGTATNNGYSIPFTTSSGIKIPLSFDKNTSGTGGTGIDFATYETSTDMNVPYPSSVTNMYSETQGGDGSLFVVDRFWRIDASSYTTNPELDVVFTYDDNANEIGGTNTITEGNLQAQRFNTTSGGWDALLFGTANTVANTVSVAAIPSADLFEFWTLVDNSSPLPVELLQFDVACVDDAAIINWATATETNNDFFTIERSVNGYDFEVVATIAGAGNSSIVQAYQYEDKNLPNGGDDIFYRLKQTDFNGNYEYFDWVALQNCGEQLSVSMYYTNEHLYIDIAANSKDNAEVKIFDLSGRLIVAEWLEVEKGNNNYLLNIPNLAEGVYMTVLNGTRTHYAQKMLFR